MIPISGISNKAGRPAEREAEMSTRKTTAGWVIETTNRVYGMLEQGGVCGREVLYTRDQIERAGFRYEDDPDGIADGEFSRGSFSIMSECGTRRRRTVRTFSLPIRRRRRRGSKNIMDEKARLFIRRLRLGEIGVIGKMREMRVKKKNTF